MLFWPGRDVVPLTLSREPQQVTLQDQIYTDLRGRLMAGIFKPGQPMSIRTIAALVGASAMPVRDALRRLESEHAIVPGPNRSLMVPLITRATLHEIRDIRLALEGLAVEAAADRMTPEALQLIAQACDEMAEAIERHQIDAYLRFNWAFHYRIYQAAGLPLLLEVIETMWTRMGPQIRVAAIEQTHFKNAMKAHWDILEALKKNDGDGARKALVHDISSAARDLDRWLSTQQKGAEQSSRFVTR